MSLLEQTLLKLDGLAVPYRLVRHPAVYTIEEMDMHALETEGVIAKNLFLRDGKGRRHFLVMVRKDKTVNLKALGEQLGVSQLGFASERRLAEYLGLTKGAVSPLGLLNDGGGSVAFVADADLAGLDSIGVHPNDNTATVFLSYAELERVIRESGHSVTELRL